MAELADLFGSDAESDDAKESEEGSQASGSPPASPQSGSGSERRSIRSGSPPGTPQVASASASPAHSGSGDGSPPGSPRGSDNESRHGDSDGESAARSRQGSESGSPEGSPKESPPASPRAEGSERGSESDIQTPPASPQAEGSERDSDSDIQTPPASPIGGSGRGSPAGSSSDRGSNRGSRAGSPAGSDHTEGSPARTPRKGKSDGESLLGSPVGSNNERRSRQNSQDSDRGSQSSRGHREGSPAHSAASGSRSPSPVRQKKKGSDDEELKSSNEEGAGRRHHSSGSTSDSGSDVVRKKKRRLASENEDGEKGAGSDDDNAEATLGDLFGDADDISSDEDREKKAQRGEEDENQSTRGMEVGEEGQGETEEPPPETRIEVEIPRIVTDLGSSLHYVKLPNFLSVETRPFDPTTYEDEIEEDEVLDEEGRARTKLRVENTIRWRSVKDEEGNELKDEFDMPVRESNARVVKWSDGSMSLHLGEEVFDVYTMPLQGNFNHLFVRQGTGLQGQSVFKTKLTFRPHSTDSFTHRKMTMSLADRSTKTQKVKVLPIRGADPDAHRSEMIKKEEERLRASIRRENQKRRLRERAQARGLSASYMEGGYDEEEEEEDGLTSISAIKRSYKQTRDKRPIYTSESDLTDESDREDSRAKRLTKAKRLDDSEEESDTEITKKKKAPRVVDSDEEGEGEREGQEKGEEDSGSD